MADRAILILPKRIKLNWLQSINSFIKSMEDLGAKVSVRGNKVVIDFKGGELDG